jgi:thymidylate kinase
MKIGKLLVFEGADEVGKTTLASMLAEELVARGVACELVGFPGTRVGTLGRHVYELHHNPRQFHVERIDPTSLQLLHVAAHIDAIDHQIIPALRKNRTVILDRFWWSTWIYGIVGRANKNSLKSAIQTEAIHWTGIRPSRVFLVTCSAPFERQASITKWKQINALYKRFGPQQRRHYPVTVIQNESTPEAAFVQVQKYIHSF